MPKLNTLAEFREWEVKYDPNGGYDCMTDAFVIKEGDRTITELDLRLYGQPGCGPTPLKGLIEAESNARVLSAAREALEVCEDIDEEWHLVHDALKQGNTDRVFAFLCQWQDKARQVIGKVGGNGTCPTKGGGK